MAEKVQHTVIYQLQQFYTLKCTGLMEYYGICEKGYYKVL